MAMTPRRSVLALTALAALAPHAFAQAPTVPPEVAAALPGATLQGSGRLRFIGLSVYDARLWRFYLAYCEAAFATRQTDVVQFTLRAR